MGLEKRILEVLKHSPGIDPSDLSLKLNEELDVVSEACIRLIEKSIISEDFAEIKSPICSICGKPAPGASPHIILRPGSKKIQFYCENCRPDFRKAIKMDKENQSILSKTFGESQMLVRMANGEILPLVRHLKFKGIPIKGFGIKVFVEVENSEPYEISLKFDESNFDYVATKSK